MNKYEYKQMKKQKRAEKREARRKARRERRERRKFKRLSNAKYRRWQMWLVKSLRFGGPLLGFGYAGYRIYKSLFTNIYSDTISNTFNLKYLSMLLVAGTVLFGFALWYGLKWMKTAIAANAVARNQGEPSLMYSPILVTFIRAILGIWLFGLLYLFNFIGVHYGEALNNGFEQAFIAYSIGFGLLLTGDIIEQSILRKIRNKKHKAQYETQMRIFEMSNEEE
jgi:hypothetical protein